MMQPIATRFIAGLGVAALIAGFVLVPRTEEQAVMSLRDGDVPAALQILETLNGTRTAAPEIAMQIYMIQEHAGNADAAAHALEDYVAAKPGDVDALAKLADLYRAAMAPERRRSALERLVAIEPSLPRTRELLGLYRSTGDTAAEARLMTSLIAHPSLGATDLARLGTLLAKDGHTAEALDAYRAADAHAPAVDYESRMPFFRLLVEKRETSEAIERAARWSAGWPNKTLITDLAIDLVEQGHGSAVPDLARKLSAVTPMAALDLAKDIAARGAVDQAEQILIDVAEANTPLSERDIARFMDAAGVVERRAPPLVLLHRLTRDPAMRVEAAIAAEGTARAFGVTALLGDHDALSYRILSARPLFGAETALTLGNPDLARRILVSTGTEQIPPEGIARWAAIVESLLGPSEAIVRLRALARAEGTPRETRLALAIERQKRGDQAR